MLACSTGSEKVSCGLDSTRAAHSVHPQSVELVLAQQRHEQPDTACHRNSAGGVKGAHVEQVHRGREEFSEDCPWPAGVDRCATDNVLQEISCDRSRLRRLVESAEVAACVCDGSHLRRQA